MQDLDASRTHYIWIHEYPSISTMKLLLVLALLQLVYGQDVLSAAPTSTLAASSTAAGTPTSSGLAAQTSQPPSSSGHHSGGHGGHSDDSGSATMAGSMAGSRNSTGNSTGHDHSSYSHVNLTFGAFTDVPANLAAARSYSIYLISLISLLFL